jgi:K+-transporting ATPase ATPase C chain
MLGQVRAAIAVLFLLTLLTGVAYPFFVTGVARALLPRQAGGSLMTRDGAPVGSELVGQAFSAPGDFWGRLSATAPFPYNAGASSGSNYGPLRPDLARAARERIAALSAADPANTWPVPVDLVTSSGSGLDPHISPAAAAYQVGRVARVRGMSADEVRAIVARCTEGRQLGFLGEPRVNVLKVNLALDEAQGRRWSGTRPAGPG